MSAAGEKVWVHTTEPCMGCSKTSTLLLDRDSYLRWQSGVPIQEAFPDLSNADREHIKTGTHPACWDAMFGNREDE